MTLTAIARLLGIKGGVILALVCLLGVQTARIEGFLWLDGLKDRIASLRGSLAEIQAAQKVAEARAIAAKLEAERKYAEKAKEIDREHQAELADASDRAARYIAANRVQCPSVGSPGSGAVAAADGSGATSSDGPGSTAIVDAVAVEAEDIHICTTNTSRLQAVRDWAKGLSRP